jgi:hypothetical protein
MSAAARAAITLTCRTKLGSAVTNADPLLDVAWLVDSGPRE